MIAQTSPAPADVLSPLRDVGDQLLAILPKVAMVALALILGLVIAAALRRGTRWVVRKTGLETLGERVGVSKVLYAIGARGSLAHLLGTVVWVAGLLLTFSVIAEMLDLPGLAEGVAAITAFLPRLIAAGFVFVIGLFLADLVRALVSRVGQRGGETLALESPRIVAQVLYYTILTVAIAMAVGQIGLDTALINTLIALAAGAVLFSAGLAFALGSRELVKNLIARHYLEAVCAVGDRLCVEESSGVVLRFTATSVVLAADDGHRLVIPCARALDVALRVQHTPEPPPGGAESGEGEGEPQRAERPM